MRKSLVHSSDEEIDCVPSKQIQQYAKRSSSSSSSKYQVKRVCKPQTRPTLISSSSSDSSSITLQPYNRNGNQSSSSSSSIHKKVITKKKSPTKTQTAKTKKNLSSSSPKITNKIPKVKYVIKKPLANQNASVLANELLTNGFTVISNTWLSDHVDQYAQQFDQAIHSMPEFKQSYHNSNKGIYVLGGFAALGNPSSFHNTFVRNVRQWSMRDTIPIFSEYIKLLELNKLERDTNEYKLEQYIDRMLYRKPDRKPTAESWHRDEVPGKHASDIIFGGWINFNRFDQHFHCIATSHYVTGDATGKAHGFNMMNKNELIHMINEQQDKGNIVDIVVPPGSILIFNENIVHEVVSKQNKTDFVRRLFLGWGLTKRSEPLKFLQNYKTGPFVKDPQTYDELLQHQASMPLKSNQHPPMYPKQTFNFPVMWNNLKQFSDEALIDQLKNDYTRTSTNKSGQKEKETHKVGPRFMTSLHHYGLSMYPPYTNSEIKIYKPNTSWHLLLPRNTINVSPVHL